MEGYGGKKQKRVENRQNRLNQGNSVDQFARTGRLDLPEARRRSVGPWRRKASNWESTP